MVEVFDEFNHQQLDPIGRGVSFPLQISVQGKLLLSSKDQNVEESILVILQTYRGERVYRADFGSRLAELVFEPLNLQTLMLIKLYVREALEMWEPRIDLRDVKTEADPNEGKVDIEIVYSLKDHSDPRSLVFPFYLQSAEVASF